MTESCETLFYNYCRKRWFCLEKVMNKKLKSRFSIHMADLVCVAVSILLGSLTSPISFTLAFLYVSYAYLRNVREACITVFFVLLFSLERGVVTTYVYALGFACYFVIVHMIKVLNQNLYVWIPYIVTVISVAFGFQQYGFHATALLPPMLSFTLMRQLLSEYTWMSKPLSLPYSIRGVILYGIALYAIPLLPLYQEAILMATMLAIACLCDEKTTAILAVSSYLLVNSNLGSIYILMVLFAVFKEDKKNTLLLLAGAFLVLPRTMETSLYLILSAASLMTLQKKDHPYVSFDLQNHLDGRLSQNSLLKRQMQNYANIFQSLSDYYTQINDVQAEILANMANALQYNADVIRKIDGVEKDTGRIRKALEGYQYEVRDLLIEEPREGCLQISMDIANIKRGEIRSTLLPLMEVLLHRNLEIETVRSRRFLNGYHHICLADDIPFEIDAYADSVKNSYTSSGDTFSIFRFRQSMVCMISDGMGNGERAAQSSRLITNIFQRMMVSGIPQDSAIKCINKLIQSDTYATLDVICFNRSQGVAYISKSAACPTFLLRDHQVYEINGSALPVGIISQMQPDCFQIDLQNGDEYLMISDGIYMDEIYKWLKERPNKNVKEDVECFAELLKKKRRKDDSTIVLARVNG